MRKCSPVLKGRRRQAGHFPPFSVESEKVEIVLYFPAYLCGMVLIIYGENNVSTY
jgi:hypothetical protein